MGKNKIGLQFAGFEELISNLDKVNGDVKKATTKALIESQKYIAEQAHKSMIPHKQSGETAASIVEDKTVSWSGMTAEIGVGFDLTTGGLPSIFLMYGTPRMAKDSNVYNAVYGNKTKKAVALLQEEIFKAAISERLG